MIEVVRTDANAPIVNIADGKLLEQLEQTRKNVFVQREEARLDKLNPAVIRDYFSHTEDFSQNTYLSIRGQLGKISANDAVTDSDSPSEEMYSKKFSFSTKPNFKESFQIYNSSGAKEIFSFTSALSQGVNINTLV